MATGKSQKFLSGFRVASEYQGCSGKPEIPEGSEDSNLKSRIGPHHFQRSPDCVPHMEKVLSIVRKINDRKPTDNLKDLDVNPSFCGKFMSVTLKAAVHLGRDYSLNLRSVKNQSSKSAEHLFRTPEKLIEELTEITSSPRLTGTSPCGESSPLCDRAVRIMKSQTYVFSWLGAMFGRHQSRTSSSLEDKIQWYLETHYLKELDQLDGEQMEFEWTFSQDSPHSEFSMIFNRDGRIKV